ncbi:Fusaric acid resistance protein-like-domain-containing protein [Polychytrium aggregatum]|uniref:Fusaric acid resistance protein-like-domain-containing protein n=1 Tax=Polychytrium aggregatum TaxID=110093 RepID=UPI0022FE1174|nr:Fusaric acid resistance protein-like-domain-containing protein [Polychytrium aggregatum]KAI9202197.1 Fusaric acid resistance protein-like-domain-containing protein [Polychytrium aggregatum]
MPQAAHSSGSGSGSTAISPSESTPLLSGSSGTWPIEPYRAVTGLSSASGSLDPIPPTSPQPAPGSGHRPVRWIDYTTLAYTLSPNRGAAKCAITFMLATLATFVANLNEDLGSASYLVATAVVFLHPARTIGSMIEAVLCSFLGMTLGYSVAYGTLAMSAVLSETYPSVPWLQNVVGILNLFLVTYLLAFIRAKINRPAVSTGCTFAHLLTFLTITQLPHEKAGGNLGDKIHRIALSLFFGTLISLFGCCAFWPTTAASSIRRDIHTTLTNLQAFFGVLSNIFSLPSHVSSDDLRLYRSQSGRELIRPDVTLEIKPVEFHHDELHELIKSHQKLLLRLEKARFEVAFELFSTMFLHFHEYKDIFVTIERLTQHLGTLKSSVVAIDTQLSQSQSSGKQNPILEEFKQKMGPSLRQLIEICRKTLATVESVLDDGQRPLFSEIQTPDLASVNHLIQSLRATIEGFDRDQRTLLMELYEKDNQEVFLVYFLIFTLLEISTELVFLSEGVWTLCQNINERRRVGRIRWIWQSWTLVRDKSYGCPRISPIPWKGGRHLQAGETTVMGIQNPAAPGFYGSIWKFFTSLREFETKFALKTALTIALMALPSYLEATQLLFYEYRLNWALTTAVVVITPSVGGSNSSGIQMIFGTIVGAVCALTSWVLFPKEPWGLFLATAIVITPSFFLFLYGTHPRIGQILLMTYSIIVLHTYASPTDPITGKDYSIYDIAYRRGVSVVAGVVIGLLVSWYVWPYKARTELRKELSGSLFDMAILYTKLVGIFESGQPRSAPQDLDQFLEQELSIRLKLTEQQLLLAQTAHEPRLKGDFPAIVYGQILDACNRILDRFVAIRAAIMGYEQFLETPSIADTDGEAHRVAMIGEILLTFYVLSGAMILKAPLPPFLPNIEACRQRLICNLGHSQRQLAAPELRKKKSFVVTPSGQPDGTFFFYYAYVIEMESVISELTLLGGLTKKLFGELDYNQHIRRDRRP